MKQPRNLLGVTDDKVKEIPVTTLQFALLNNSNYYNAMFFHRKEKSGYYIKPINNFWQKAIEKKLGL